MDRIGSIELACVTGGIGLDDFPIVTDIRRPKVGYHPDVSRTRAIGIAINAVAAGASALGVWEWLRHEADHK